MSKKYFILYGFVLMILSAPLAMAEVFQTQSPIYTDDIGRSHFLGRGGYSSVRHLDMGAAQADAINDVSRSMQRVENEVKQTVNNTVEEAKQTVNDVETDITKVIKEPTNVPVSAKAKASFTAEDRQLDPAATFGRGAVYLPSSGVNASKTIYTDEIGRLHFFRKDNQIKE